MTSVVDCHLEVFDAKKLTRYNLTLEGGVPPGKSCHNVKEYGIHSSLAKQ